MPDYTVTFARSARKELEDIIKMAAITERIGSKSFMK